MVSLLIESYANKIKNAGILKDNSKAKKLLQVIFEPKIDILNNLFSIRANLDFREINTDLLTKMKNNRATIYSLEKRGYQKTRKENFNYDNFNHIIEKKNIPIIIQDEELFKTTLKLNGKEEEKNYRFFFEDDYIVFVPVESNSSVEYYYKLNGYKILDFKIDKYDFVYMIVEKDNKRLFVTSHLFKCFSVYNVDDSSLNLKECYNIIDVTKEKIISLEYIKSNDYYFLQEDNKILKISFSKKYYFEDGEFIYFNNYGDMNDFEKDFIEVVQNNFLNMYNYLNFLGLNDFKIGDRKLSSIENELFLEIFKNRFDNTLNGGLNYFNAKKITNRSNISQEIKDMYNSVKDYHVNISDEYFSIKGNFVYKNFKKGKYKIEITEKEARLLEYNKDNPRLTLIEKVKIPDYEEFYFCNLKFNYKKFEFIPSSYSFDVSSFDTYLFKHGYIDFYKLNKIPNNPTSLNIILNNSKEKTEPDMNVSFDGRKIIFKNFFDWKNKKFKYGHLESNVKSQEVIDINTFKDYQCSDKSIVKHNKVYSRDNGKLYYTRTDSFDFELINENGYITPFWANNQNKTIYFKNEDNLVKIINNKYESDFYCYIPSIKNYVRNDKKIYSNVYVNVSDSLDVNLKLSDRLLVTNKYLNEPLFYKVYIEDKDILNIHIYDNDDLEVIDTLQEEYNNGYIFYFNIKPNKKYYYNTSSGKYNYFTPLKAYKNIESIYYFNETGYINMNEPKKLKSFALKSNVLVEKDLNIFLFLYNTVTGETNKISLTRQELNHKFELDLEIDKIYIEIEGNSDYKKNLFYIVEDSNNSLVENDNLIYFKSTRQDIIYIAEKNIQLDYKKIDFTKFKVNTYYRINDYNDFVIDNTGTFIIDEINNNEIAILPNEIDEDYIETKVFLAESLGDKDDKFYIKNFKALGNYYINHDIEAIKIADTTNTITSTDEIFLTGGTTRG